MNLTENYLEMYQEAQRYLKLSHVYAGYLGGLRWSAVEDVLVDEQNRPFAFCEAIAEFVEGFAAQGRAVPFGYLLHWMDLLQNQRGLTDMNIRVLRQIFLKTKSNWRFAGAFAAYNSARVPEVPDPPNLAAVGKRLRNRAFPIRWFTSQFHEAPGGAEQPPIAPGTFEKMMILQLATYSEEELRIWLGTGRGPIREAERLAEEPPLPRSLARALASLIERPRLSGAQVYVPQLVGALTLPPRRFVPQELPVGGYTDIVTRGQVEHLLPTQFALDELEFLRRYAEKELLYFRREEPPAQNRQELVVLLDQGVRTWGDVRLVLAAAALAFGKQALLRKTPFFLAATSNRGHVIEPTSMDEEELGQLIEASDLSLNPGLALEQTLESPRAALRDLVLLTHPRSLRHQDVLGAACRLGPNDRLFAVTLDAHGEVEVSEIRRGTPIKVHRFHIDFAPSQPKPQRRTERAEPASTLLWTGDVEAIPFPFRLGTEPHVTHFDFDYDGKWLLTVSGQATLHLWNLDGTGQEMLPRPCRETVLKTIIGVHGVVGGFVVIGKHAGHHLIVAHYDVVRRHGTWYDLGVNHLDQATVCYVEENHTIAICEPTSILIELDTEEVIRPSTDLPARASHTWSKVNAGLIPNRILPCIHLSEATGQFTAPGRGMFTPLNDGKPCFQNGVLYGAQLAGDTWAIHAIRQDIGESITLMQAPDGAIIREYPIARPKHQLTRHLLSFDGTRIALLRSDDRVEVDPVFDRSLSTLCTRVGGYPMETTFSVGKRCVMILLGPTSQFWHLFDWANGKLEHHYERASRTTGEPDGLRNPRSAFYQRGPFTTADLQYLPSPCKQDPDRYRLRAFRYSLSFALDRFGQLAVLDGDGSVLAMFIAFRDHHAAWMSDGTRLGTLSLGPATPGAAEKIGQRLLQENTKCEERSTKSEESK